MHDDEPSNRMENVSKPIDGICFVNWLTLERRERVNKETNVSIKVPYYRRKLKATNP